MAVLLVVLAPGPRVLLRIRSTRIPGAIQGKAHGRRSRTGQRHTSAARLTSCASRPKKTGRVTPEALNRQVRKTIKTRRPTNHQPRLHRKKTPSRGRFLSTRTYDEGAATTTTSPRRTLRSTQRRQAVVAETVLERQDPTATARRTQRFPSPGPSEPRLSSSLSATRRLSCEFLLELLQPLHVAGLHPAALRPPTVVGRLRHF